MASAPSPWMLAFISITILLFARVTGFIFDLVGDGHQVEPVTGPRTIGAPVINDTAMTRIVNGELATLGEIPYLVSFRFNETPGPSARFFAFCGGTLLKPAKVLSAAHCFMDFHTEWCSRGHTKEQYLRKTIAVMGTLKNLEPLSALTAPAQHRRLKNVWYPDTYVFPKDDICVVILKQPFELTSEVGVLAPAQAYVNYAGTCLAAGFGRTSNDTTKLTMNLYKAHLEILPTADCSALMGRSMRHYVCTKTQKNNIAPGDSGGPLMCYGGGSEATVAGAACANVHDVVTKVRISLFTRASSFRTYVRRAAAPTPPRVLPPLFAATLLVMML